MTTCVRLSQTMGMKVHNFLWNFWGYFGCFRGPKDFRILELQDFRNYSPKAKYARKLEKQAIYCRSINAFMLSCRFYGYFSCYFPFFHISAFFIALNFHRELWRISCIWDLGGEKLWLMNFRRRCGWTLTRVKQFWVHGITFKHKTNAQIHYSGFSGLLEFNFYVF